ncbi:hypothetical protein QZH41_008271 [Actinostola sp. cb2023]|nr:hypothetical protein QZH41_008271 [Actinostola sp. cb2023]
MGEKNFKYIKQFVKDVTKQFAIGQENTQIGVIPFSHYYKVAIKLNQFTDYVTFANAVDSLDYEGAGSSLSGALKISQLELFIPENGGRKEGIKIVEGGGLQTGRKAKRGVLQALVVISDGGSSTGVDALLNSAETLKNSGKRVFVVGLGRFEHLKNIKMMASEPVKKHVFLVKEGEELSKLVYKLTQGICKDIRPVMKKFTVMENGKVITSLTYTDT